LIHFFDENIGGPRFNEFGSSKLDRNMDEMRERMRTRHDEMKRKPYNGSPADKNTPTIDSHDKNLISSIVNAILTWFNNKQ